MWTIFNKIYNTIKMMLLWNDVVVIGIFFVVGAWAQVEETDGVIALDLQHSFDSDDVSFIWLLSHYETPPVRIYIGTMHKLKQNVGCHDHKIFIKILIKTHKTDNAKTGPNPEFVLRKTITVRPFKSSVIQLPADVQLTESQRAKLVNLARTSGIYRIRAQIRKQETVNYLYTFIPACSLYESGLSDTLTVHTDGFGEPISISATTSKPQCDGSLVPLSHLTHFNTIVEVRPIEPGPSPDTTAFIQKIDREKAEKAKGEQGDSRSFFAKYDIVNVPNLLAEFPFHSQSDIIIINE